MFNSRPLKLRIIAIILTLAALLTSLPLTVLAEEIQNSAAQNSENTPVKPSVEILHDGALKNSITLLEDGKENLRARVEGISVKSRNWQILNHETNEWVNIYARTQETLPVTYALIGSMLNDAGRAYIRLQVGDGKSYYVSESVEIILAYNPTVRYLEEANGFNLKFAKPTADTDTGELQTYSIVINYIFDNGTIAFEPYGASVAAGSDFKATIPSPTVVGYEPFRRDGASYTDATEVILDYTDINENITVNVIYEPAMVEFQVHHHFQNLLDDDYSLQPDRITKSMGLTNSTVPKGLAFTQDELPGFKALAYEELTIAADGSTVVEIRYDRNYYLISFDMQGGFGTEPLYTRFGSSVGANAPTKPGYLFDGWELVSYGGETPSEHQKSQYDINSALITVPDANLVYEARWITQVTGYTMVFWKENINDNGFTFWGYLSDLQAMSGSYVSGSDRVREAIADSDVGYFTYNDALTDKNVMIEGDGSTVINVYYTRNRYSITFKAPGLCVIPEGHTHTDACYDIFCKGEHVHGEGCLPKLTCPLDVHTEHTDSCIICGKVQHTHGTECCNLPVHTHTSACYNNVGNTARPNGAPANPVDGQIYKRGSSYYVYIGSSWYRYTGRNVSSGDIIDPACNLVNHTHSDSCCALAEHTHTDICYRDTLHEHEDHCYTYSCGKVEHTHSDACYILNCGIPTGHTHSSTCTRATSTNTVKIEYKKYQQNLGKDPDSPDDSDGIWPIVDGNGVVYDDGQRWTPSGSNTYSQVLVYIANMPGENFTLTVNTSTNEPYTMNYYLEVLPNYVGETVTLNGKRFMHYTTILARYSYLTYAEDFFNIKGYTQYVSDPAFNSNDQISIGSNSDRTVNLYYTRQTDHYLNFQSNGAVLFDKSVHGIQYGESLKQYEFVPDYPSSLEPNAYFFDGWYTSPGHYDGTEVDWDTLTMEAGGVLLYAKWSPLTHTVKVYTDDTLTVQVGDAQEVSHGNFAAAPKDAITNGNYIFQGWFYKETDADGNTVEKAFLFNGIPILQDLNIYAKWSSHVTVNYTINYVLEATGEKIAPTLKGSAIAGHNKTFYAKAGEELNEGFRAGFYPTTNSHTVTMSAESDHEFTFYYVYVESMPYAVRYVDEDGNEILSAKKVFDNSLSVVTETFLKVDGKMPDAYQKRLILSADGIDTDGDKILDNNVIVFRYKSDTQHAYYKVVHYIQNMSGDGYREYRSEETVGIIGENYTITPITLTGFGFNSNLTKINGTLTPSSKNSVNATLGADGLLVELYYDRQNMSYTVNYLESGTDKVLYEQKVGGALYGAQAVEYAPVLTGIGYSLVSESVKQLHVSADQTLNVINFYYQETVCSIKYQIVGPDSAGTLSMTSENVKAVTGTPNGSYPIINAGYTFRGWYLDEACTQPVDASWVDGETNRISPVRNGVWPQSNTYYAKIDPDYTSLTVSTFGAADIDEGQVFLFRIQGTSEATVGTDITVMVIGNSSVTVENLFVGTYSVTEIVSWSYRYTPDSVMKSVRLTANVNNNKVIFSHVRGETKWLDNSNVAQGTYTAQ